MDRNIVLTPALTWLIKVINEGGKKREEMFQDGLRCYALAQSKLYVKGLGKMSHDEQANKMGAAFVGHCKETIKLFKKVIPASMTPEYIRCKNTSKPKVPKNDELLNQAKVVKANVVNRILPAYKAELVKRDPPTMPSGKNLEELLDNVLETYWIQEEKLRLKNKKRYKEKKEKEKKDKKSSSSKNKKDEEDNIEETSSTVDDIATAEVSFLDFLSPITTHSSPITTSTITSTLSGSVQPRPLGYMPGAMWVFILMSEVAEEPVEMFCEAVDQAIGVKLREPIVLGPGEQSLAGLGRDKRKRVMAENARIRANLAIKERNCARQKRRDNNEENVSEDETEELDSSEDSKRKRSLENLERQGEETTKAVTQMAHEIARKGEEARLKEIYNLEPTMENKQAYLNALKKN